MLDGAISSFSTFQGYPYLLLALLLAITLKVDASDVEFQNDADDFILKERIEYYQLLRDSYVEEGCEETWGEFPTREGVEHEDRKAENEKIVLTRRGRRAQTQGNSTANGMVCSCGLLHDLGLFALNEIIEIEESPHNGAAVGEIIESAMASIQTNAKCVNGFASSFPCKNVDLVSFIPRIEFRTPQQKVPKDANDVWGWTSKNGREIVIWGVREGVYFIEIKQSSNPIVLGFLPTSIGEALQRDVKVIGNFAYIGNEAHGHGIQFFDMRRLLGERNCVDAKYCKKLTANLVYKGTRNFPVGNTHNIVVNPDSRYLYAVGGSNGCGGGLHAVDVSKPLQPVFAGCFGGDGYVHDAHCINYNGPDKKYIGREICACFNEDTITIVDVSNKSDMKIISKGFYDARYTHQGWFSHDRRHIIFGDEVDEIREGGNTRTLIFDVADLERPKNFQEYFGRTVAIDHNQYIDHRNGHDFVFQANYAAGLSILKVNDYSTGDFKEVGYFDTTPSTTNSKFIGAWSTYPYFNSGLVVVSSIRDGLFVVKPTSPGIEIKCEDDTKLKYQKRKRKDCNWVGQITRGKPKITRQRTKKRCKKTWNGEFLSSYCPTTCGKVGIGRCQHLV